MLEWLSAELCDVVTGLDTSGALLDELYRRSMFLIPLDAAGRAFRYHHLFAEVLYFRLRIEDPESVDELHHRAAAWLLQHGRDEEGVAQLLAAGDTREAFTVISAAGHRLFESGQSATLVRWLSTIVQAPQSPAAVEVNLLAAQLGADDATGAAETHRRICRRADLTLGERTAANALYASLAIRGLPPETVLNITDEVREALPALGPDDVVDFLGIGGRDSVELISEYSTGLAHFFKGDLDRAAATLGHVRTLPGMKYPLWTAYVLGSLALVRAWQGHSREAAGLADSAIKEARSFGTDLHHATTHAHQALALTHLDHMELDAAKLDLAGATLAMRGRTASGTFVDLQLALRVRLLVAREGPVAALKLLRAPAATGAEAPVLWGARQALRIQLLGAVGDLAGARALLRDDRPNPQMPPVHIDLALATGDIPAARAALEQWRPAADDTRNLVRRLLREFVVLTAEGSSRAAKASLTEAVGVARGNRLRSPFLEVPSALRAVRQGVGHGAWLKDDALWQVAGRLEPLVHAQGKLIEPLTGRELAVLAYLPGRMKNLEIAADLFVSVNTIKTQIGSIYRKLGVTERNEAVARAQRLGLL
jgi:LuxR family maltose regulon positive regulatory protein